MGEPGTLIKFGEKDHLRQLQGEGLLYLNHLQHFWETEDEELRGDPFDCIAKVARGQKIGLALSDGKEVFVDGNWTLGMNPPEPDKINIFCMYALRPLIERTFPVDERNFRFGKHALVLINRDKFMHRVESCLQSTGIRFKADLVKYVNDEHTGKIGPFRKFKKFRYQSEWRLVCYDGPGKPREIRIDSLQDISLIIQSNKVNEELGREKLINPHL